MKEGEAIRKILLKTIAKTHLINTKGSFTVEASILFSLVFLLLVVLVYTFIIMYQYTTLQSVANEAANRGAAYYVKQFEEGTKWPLEKNPYWRIFDTNDLAKKTKIKNYSLKELEPSIVNSNKFASADTSYNILLKQFRLGLEEQYPLPIGELLAVFGILPKLVLKAEASCPMEDNAEFVRNLDMVIDIKNCLINSDNKWIGGGSKVSEVVDKLIKKK